MASEILDPGGCFIMYNNQILWGKRANKEKVGEREAGGCYLLTCTFIVQFST
mgnify:CR=1 FL=1